MKILELHLKTPSLADQRDFYVHTLDFPLLEETPNSATLQAGETRLVFEQAEAGWKGFYHLAFNINENHLASAKDWLMQQGMQLLTDVIFGFDEVHHEDWNAHSVYFYDLAGNRVEFIARHNLPNASVDAFGAQSILSVSEVALVAENVNVMVETLQLQFGLPLWKGDRRQLAAVGDEDGLFVIYPPGTAGAPDHEKPEQIQPLDVTIAGDREKDFQFSDFPYRIRMQAATRAPAVTPGRAKDVAKDNAHA